MAIANPRPHDDKFNERRAQLGEATLQTLASLGYARTSLREIAQNSQFSHGVLHYYFKDKFDLILCSVRQYKAVCVQRYDEVVASATSAPQLLEGFCAALGATLRDEAALHRLWYDLRSQALFEDGLRADVTEIDASLERMIWRVVSRYAALAGQPPRLPSAAAYAMLDGLFQQALLLHLGGDKKAVARMQQFVRTLMEQLVEEAPPAAPKGRAVAAPRAAGRRPARAVA
ncbi:MAG TPA: TetR/AcrR family transcriptional regulator [Variovorax sp.]|nr:TetR/AcrR family transcriptional regulator [Variovorax sp.]